MANTLLNTGTTAVATSNPITNVNQVQTNSANPTVPNINATQGQINPITIPIQIQPQVTSSGYAQTTSGQTNNNMQAIAPSQSTTAPTPQTYKANNQNNNYVDFNQIYSAYQSQYGNTYNSNNNAYNSGIKKTSIGTTIVTPKTANLNTVQGQYQSAYADTINSVISTLLTETQNMKNGFNYDPSQDMALRVASEYAANSTLQSLAGSGVLNSSSTSERVARIVSELIPQYEKLAYDRQVQYLNQLANTADIVMSYDSQQFQYWKDAKDREFQEKEFDFKKKQQELENAWKRVDELGYVDNKASTILGVKVGTLSGAAREAKEQREYELNKMREQYSIEYKNNVAIAKLKNELELKSSKELANYKAQIDKDLYAYKSSIDTAANKDLASYQSSLSRSNKEYEYQLAQKYGSSSGSSNSNYTNLSTHDDIIKNRWAEYDDFTKKYTITDTQAAYDYLKNAYASGTLSMKDANALINKYGLNSSSSTSSTSTTIAGLSNTAQQIYDTYKGNYEGTSKSENVKQAFRNNVNKLKQSGVLTESESNIILNGLGI